MHVELLVEEPSAEAALRILLPKILEARATFQIHPFQGKQDLLTKLPRRLRGYSGSLPPDSTIVVLVVLVDEDREDCRGLKQQLERAASRATLTTKSAARRGQRVQVVNRIAVEELEAWFFGDVPAMVRAYPGIPATPGARSRFRDPDAIKGGTAEALERVLQKAGYHLGGLRKTEAARDIAKHMDPDANRSRSFQHFRRALRGIVGLKP